MSEEGSDHRKASENLGFLWNEVQSYLEGDYQDKNKALDLLFGKLNLPSEMWLKSVVKLADVKQPPEIRRRIANFLKSKNRTFTVKEYFALLKVLAEDPDKEIVSIVEQELGFSGAAPPSVSGLFAEPLSSRIFSIISKNSAMHSIGAIEFSAPLAAKNSILDSTTFGVIDQFRSGFNNSLSKAAAALNPSSVYSHDFISQEIRKSQQAMLRDRFLPSSQIGDIHGIPFRPQAIDNRDTIDPQKCITLLGNNPIALVLFELVTVAEWDELNRKLKKVAVRRNEEQDDDIVQNAEFDGSEFSPYVDKVYVYSVSWSPEFIELVIVCALNNSKQNEAPDKKHTTAKPALEEIQRIVEEHMPVYMQGFHFRSNLNLQNRPFNLPSLYI